MVKINYNERSWAIDVIYSINEWANNKNVIIKRAGGENTLISEDTMFPDVLLYGDSSAGVIIQGWELKMPDTSINDEDLISNAYDKAINLGLDSFLVWNVTTAVLYRIKENKPEILHQWNELSDIKSREKVLSSEKRWKECLYHILDDLIFYFNKGDIKPISVIESLSNDNLSNIILKNSSNVAKEIELISQKDVELLDEINIWWYSVKKEYESTDKYLCLANLVLVSWMNKFLFANLLKKYQDYAYEVDKIVAECNLSKATHIFETISNNCDFKNIFNKQLGEECIPNITWNILKSFNEFLISIRLDKLKQKYLQQILSNIVKKSSKRLSGQFITPYNLAYFLSNFVVLNKNGTILDPCCGTGTIIKACNDLKVSFSIDEKESLNNLWASDKFAFPLQLAMFSMTNPNQMGEIVHIFKEDVIDLYVNKEIKFNNPLDGSEIPLLLPKMDYILSNLPFVQQEDIKEFNPKIKDNINNKIQKLTNNKKLTLPGKCDLCAYIPFTLWSLLESKGKLGLIISNSWLGANWGSKFYYILQKFFQVEYILTSGEGKWFEDVDVVTNILVLKKLDNPELDIDLKSETSYVTLNCNIKNQSFLNNNDTICSLIRTNNDSKYFNNVTYTKLEEKQILDLGLSKNALFTDVKWILELKDKLIKVSDIFEISRGARRGWDEMFFPSNNHNIDKNYIKKVIKSNKEIGGYVTQPQSDAFCCEKSIDELKALNHINTIRWINKFENQVNGKGKPLPEVLKKPGIFWYTMKPETVADVCISINPGDRLFFSRLEKQSFVNQRLTRLLKKDNKIDIKLSCALLNSILGIFLIESLGFGRGLGALDLNSNKLKDNLFMLNYKLLNEEDIVNILNKYEKLEKRAVLNIEEELMMEDRKDFDLTVLSAFQIEEYYDKISDSLIQLFTRRKTVRTNNK